MRTSVKNVVSIRDMVLAGSGIVCQEGGDRVILGDVMVMDASTLNINVHRRVVNGHCMFYGGMVKFGRIW
jgi:hypothetical protein